jgi:putative peptidoglycan lipid II flippase
VAPATVVVQVCSFASSVALAHVLGAGVSTDAYYLGLSVPVLVYGILLGALRAGVVPALTDLSVSVPPLEFKRSLDELAGAVLVGAIALVLVVSGLTELFLPLIAGGALLHETRLVVVELIPYGVLGAAGGLLSAALAVKGRFVVPVLAMSFEPVAKTVLTVVAGDSLGIQALIIGNLVGALGATILLWRALAAAGPVIRPVLARSVSSFVQKTLVVSAPVIVSMSVLQVNPVIDRAMVSSLASGSVTAFELGLRLYLVPSALLASLAIGPLTATWAARRATGGDDALRQSLGRAITAVSVVTPPIVITLLALRREVTLFVFAGGAYSSHALDITTDVFALAVIALPAQVLITAFASLFVVHKSTIFPMKVAFANVILNVALNFALRPNFGAAGIALSTSLTHILLLVVYAIAASRRWNVFVGLPVRGLALRCLASSTLGVSAAFLLVRVIPTATDRVNVLWTGAVVCIGVACATMLPHSAALLRKARAL